MTKRFFTVFLLVSFWFSAFSQTYILTGNPINTAGWTIVGHAAAQDDFIRLTTDEVNKVGAINLNQSFNLNYCYKWKVEFDFRIDGNGTADLGKGDGLAFWYLVNPPSNYVFGEGLGIPSNAVGLMVGFDIFNNTNASLMSKIHVLYGVNTGNIEFNNTSGSTFHTADLLSTSPFVGNDYRHIVVTGEQDAAIPGNTIIKLWLNDVQLVNRSFRPSGAAATMTKGYFGFSAATGGATARHSIKNVKVFIDKTPVFQTNFTPVLSCPDLQTGNLTTNLKTFENQMVSDVSKYTFTYFKEDGVTVINNPQNYQFSAAEDIKVVVHENNGQTCDNEDVRIFLRPDVFPFNNAVLAQCVDGTSGTFDLTSAQVSTQTNLTKIFYRNLNDLLLNQNPINNSGAYPSSNGQVFVKLTSTKGCSRYAVIDLQYSQAPSFQNVELTECFSENEPSSAVFDLSTASVTQNLSAVKEFYKTRNDAELGQNIITNFSNYQSENATVFAKIKSSETCYRIAEIKLSVIPPIVITGVRNENSIITVLATGGVSPYQYSADGNNWQSSNQFALSEGAYQFFVRDNFGCNVAAYEFAFQNLPNVITPNGDGINDVFNYSLLAKKQNFKLEIFNRTGEKVHASQTDQKGFWDGTSGGRKVVSGSYWFVVSWTENDLQQSSKKFTGWILVKNRP